MFPSQVGGSPPSTEQQRESCALVDEAIEQPCTERDAFQILEQFEQVYQNKIDQVETAADVTDAQRNELKVKIMMDWIKDLREQNTLLIHTVNDLEQAAVHRVKLLEDKLHETSHLMTQNMSLPHKSEEDLNEMAKRIQQLESEQSCLQKNVESFQNDIDSLLELIKRGRMENNWNLEGLTFHQIQPSDIPAPSDCTCGQIGCVIDNQENVINNKDLEIENLYKQLNNIEKNYNNLQHEFKCKMNDFQKTIEDNSKLQKENIQLRAWLACEKKESSEAREALAQEVAQKHDSILELKKKISHLEDQIQDSKSALNFKEDIISHLRLDLKAAKSGSAAPRRVRIGHDSSQLLEDTNLEEKLNDAIRQKEELKSLLALRDIEISKLRTGSENSNENIHRKVAQSAHNVSIENQGEILTFLTNLCVSMAKDIETILSLKMEHETVLTKLEESKLKYEEDVALANEMLQDMQLYLHQYKHEVLNPDECNGNMRECINTMENKIIHIQKLFQNQCERCVKENLLLEMNEVISKVLSGIQTISEIYENKNKSITSIEILIKKNSAIYNKNTSKEYEQKAIFTAILQQFRMMEEFRICTVEVQAATEDLREEMTSVISNLNARHCKYVELTKMVSHVQDYLTRTRENISEIINRLELQDEERARHNERITNNRIRLKDIKNEFNHTQSELKKCLNNVHSNIQHSNLLGYTEICTCNDLLTSVVEEVEQLVCNLHTFQSQGCCGLSTMTELKKQLTLMEHNVKELKKKCDQVLLENEAAQKSFTDKSKRLEKYECEVDNCHTKMQDVLENIIAIRDKMNEFEYIKEVDDSFESTNETIKLKEEIRSLQKECEELKRKLLQESIKCQKDDRVSEWENRIIDLKDQITVLQNEIKFKQEANIFLKQSLESLEKELESMRMKAEACRRVSSTESFEMKKRIFELENLLRVHNDTDNNVKSLANNETDSKKSQQRFDFYTKDRLVEAAIKHGLQGSHENIAQLLNVLQDTIQAIKSGLQELSDKLKRLVLDGSSHTCNSSESVRAAIEILAKYVESIKYCSFEIEKIKAALYSKDKLMENKDEIIRIQKDSITISQSEVEDLHKTLQEKIDAQEKAITECEKEKSRLNKQIELQVQTIGHLQEAVVEAKRTIDQLSNKATSDVSEPWTSVSPTIFNHSNVHDV
ncbi:ELKS/Rab6-interacting/CAST family member 1 isoform X2 [Nasonia vitripennis]|uniref:Uncharacterized protein n=1 Tax=Nasonia vitripennis TaxID=7425 RepID=A0A7M7PYI8_NASVI|nr:ELKS/Rab6-interacting/CAST family member 1 isoform X2 [Nasonia vitripennis]